MQTSSKGLVASEILLGCRPLLVPTSPVGHSSRWLKEPAGPVLAASRPKVIRPTISFLLTSLNEPKNHVSAHAARREGNESIHAEKQGANGIGKDRRTHPHGLKQQLIRSRTKSSDVHVIVVTLALTGAVPQDVISCNFLLSATLKN
jgi:hypothetical protein